MKNFPFRSLPFSKREAVSTLLEFVRRPGKQRLAPAKPAQIARAKATEH